MRFHSGAVDGAVVCEKVANRLTRSQAVLWSPAGQRPVREVRGNIEPNPSLFWWSPHSSARLSHSPIVILYYATASTQRPLLSELTPTAKQSSQFSLEYSQIVIEVLVCRCIIKGKTKVKYEKECLLKGNPHKSSWWPANSPKRRVALTTCCRHDRGNRSADDVISREAQQREGAEQRDCQGRQSAQFADRRRPLQFKFTLRLTVSLCDLAWDGARVDCFQCTALLECFSVSLWQTRTGSRRRQKLVL